jgi:hypothetical protein
VDNDDTIEPDLCEKAVAIADAEQADTTYFFYDRGEDQTQANSIHRWSCQMKELIRKQHLTEHDYSILLQPMIWLKLWRSHFLLDNDIRCPIGQYSEDTFMSWQTVVLNPKIALLPEIMYHWRLHSLSTGNEPTKKYLMGIPATYNLIKNMLLKTGHYHGVWKNRFLHQKLCGLYRHYKLLPAYRRVEYLRMVKDLLDQDEQEYLLQKNNLKRRVRVFYFALLGLRFAAIENAVYMALRRTGTFFRKLRSKRKQIS